MALYSIQHLPVRALAFSRCEPRSIPLDGSWFPPLRDALGLSPGSTVEISRYGAGLQLLPMGRTARLEDESGILVASGDAVIDDADVFALIDSGRR
jgi:hypothetical protein